MIDLALLRKQPALVIELLKKKEPQFDAARLYELDRQVIHMRQEVESLQAHKNKLAQQGKQGVTEQLREESIALGKELKEKTAQLALLEEEYKLLHLQCPNIPDAALPLGNKEANKVIKTIGEKPTFNFPIKNHVELGTALGWFDFERAAQMAGSNFALYKGGAVRLLYSLTELMVQHNMLNGYEPILPPALVNEQSLEVASNFPKFRDQVYEIPKDKLYLIPTSEVSLTNLYRDHIFMADQLPVRMTSWTSCFRREAGSYGSTERGLIRIHQFEKAELYTMCAPEDSEREHEKMLACAEAILKLLGLHYRVSLLAMQDCSFPSAKTYDIEVWLPGQNTFMEVSSCSNCTDFQSRRGMIRYRKHADEKPQLVHTLNASSLAVPRLMVALMETYQQPDGTIALPEILLKSGWWR